jgi:hypothetical protein
MSQQASFGQLALTYCGKFLPLEILHSAAGHYIGTRDTEGPVSRESASTSAAMPRLNVPSKEAAGPSSPFPDPTGGITS